MGTNYYWHEKPPCECCKRPFEPKHIGKSSAGWCFSLHVYPEQGINNLDDWKKKWQTGEIKDEYDKIVTPAEMEEDITKRGPGPGIFDRIWLNSNHAVAGPNGLARSKIDGTYCIGHGEGTWDLIVGEFS